MAVPSARVAAARRASAAAAGAPVTVRTGDVALEVTALRLAATLAAGAEAAAHARAAERLCAQHGLAGLATV